jgi:hypothetical protein
MIASKHVRLVLVPLAFFLCTFMASCGGGGGGGGGGDGGGDDTGGPSTFTFRAGWVNEGIVVEDDPSPLDDICVVRLDGGQYRIYADNYYHTNPFHEFISFTSNDGVNFTRDPGVRWSGGGYHPLVYKFPNGDIRLYYTDAGVPNEFIRSAVSADGGLTFIDEPGDRLTRDPGIPEEVDGIGCVGMIRLPSGMYRMYYGGGLPGVGMMFSALSNDGLSFTREPGTRWADDPDWQNPNRTAIGAGEPIIDSNGTWHMFGGGFYSGLDAIYDLTSPDGLTFTVDPVPIITSYRIPSSDPPPGFSTELIMPQDPSPILTDDGLRFYWIPYREDWNASPPIAREPGVTAIWSCWTSSIH